MKDDFKLGHTLVIVASAMAIGTWEAVANPIIRATRWLRKGCLVCGRFTNGWRYCSLECAAYDGCLKDERKSRILFGTVMSIKKHHESRD